MIEYQELFVLLFSQGKHSMQYGMPTLIELSTLEDTIKLCKKLQLSFIELNMNLPQYQIERLENTDELLRLANENKIFFTIHLDENLNICDFNRAVANAYLQTVQRAIEVAKKLNIPVLNMHMNHGVHFTLPEKKVQLFEKYNYEYMDSWKTFRNMCEKQIGKSNIKICIENTDGFRSYEKAAIDFLLQSNVFALTWDIGHSASVQNIDEPFIMSHEDRLYHFHIHDCLQNKNHMTLGTGEIDLHQRLLLAQKHNCRCVIETKTVDSLRKSVGWVNKNF